MNIELGINGFVEMIIYNYHTKEQIKEKDTIQGILDNLQQCEYTISLKEKVIVDINELSNPLYSFEIVPTCSISYEFNSL